jgi:hypothetical protein
MIITGTSDKIQFKLGASVASTQLPYSVDYNNYTSNSVTLLTNNGTSNNTTAVDLVTSPSASQQNELRYCSIYNSDTSNATISIQVFDGANTRVVFQAILDPGSTLQFQLEKGWEVIDQSGNKKNIGVSKFGNNLSVGNVMFRAATAASTQTLTGTNGVWFVLNLGRVDKAYSTITFQYRVTQAAATITYAELAVYSGFVKQSEGTGSIYGVRRGFTNIASVVNSTGIKTTAVSVSGMLPGELFQVVISVQATTVCIIRAMGISDSTATLTNSTTVLSVTGGRPSLVSSGPYPTAGISPVTFAWQGT